jgi:hypothetical protein
LVLAASLIVFAASVIALRTGLRSSAPSPPVAPSTLAPLDSPPVRDPGRAMGAGAAQPSEPDGRASLAPSLAESAAPPQTPPVRKGKDGKTKSHDTTFFRDPGF